MAARFDPQAFHRHPSRLIRAIERMRVRALGRLLAPRPEEQVLEVGCGPGDVLLSLPPCRRLGLDISSTLLARARQRLGPGVPLVRGDAERLPFAAASLAGVVCSEVLEHTLAPERVLRELARVLRPGGRAVVSIPEEALINRLKGLVRATGLHRLPGLRQAAQEGGGESGYRMARRMDDAWHLHAFSLGLLRQVTPPELHWTAVVSIPSRLLPLRRVVAMVRDFR